jgi:hypothetical protein
VTTKRGPFWKNFFFFIYYPYRHQIRSRLLPKQNENSPEETIKKVVRGVTCFDFSTHAQEMFVVGAEGGLVVQCSLLGTRKLPGQLVLSAQG